MVRSVSAQLGLLYNSDMGVGNTGRNMGVFNMEKLGLAKEEAGNFTDACCDFGSDICGDV